jgi:hypothetical protein
MCEAIVCLFGFFDELPKRLSLRPSQFRRPNPAEFGGNGEQLAPTSIDWCWGQLMNRPQPQSMGVGSDSSVRIRCCWVLVPIGALSPRPPAS